MMTKKTLSSLAEFGSVLMYEIAFKHEDGVFLPEITRSNPHYHKEVGLLLKGYCKLLKEISVIFHSYEKKSQEDADAMIEQWLDKLKDHRSKETKLLFDSMMVDIGGDH